jgi:hypothetical protein
MSELLEEVSQHYRMWTEDNEKRESRVGGWNDITDAYYGRLPDKWPYITKIVDPRIRTSLIEKNARLLNSKLRGRFVPREGGDVLGAQLNNALIDFQWDSASNGGSMLNKLEICDMDARMYQSKFGMPYWLKEFNEDGTLKFEGNEFKPLDIRDCGMDPGATHIKDAIWFQVRTWEYLDELEKKVDVHGKPIFKELKELRRRVEENLPKGSQRRSKEYTSRVKQLRGLEDRLGEDIAFPVIMLVTEYREGKWITFTPDYDLVLRETKNPYAHGKIPIAQLRYYPLQDDPLGESEVEAVIPIWKAIQATVCSYMDEVILKMRPPLKIVENQARIETIEYGPEAQWLVDNQDAVQEMKSTGDSLAYFQTTYSALVSAFNIAMGDMSQGTSAIDPFETEKTATEVRASLKQQSVRDQKNQNDLAEFIKDIVMMWKSNNKQFLFSDPDKHEFVLRIVGSDQFDYFKKAGLADLDVPAENARLVADIIQQKPDMSDAELLELYDTAAVPSHPVALNPSEKDPEKIKVKPKMTIGKMEDEAELSITPSDLEGLYDYIPDVKSMALGAGEELAEARQRAIELFTSNPVVLQLMAEEGFKPSVKELMRSTLEDMGLKDAERFFVRINPTLDEQEAAQGTTQEVPGAKPPSQVGGLPAAPPTNTPISLSE